MRTRIPDVCVLIRTHAAPIWLGARAASHGWSASKRGGEGGGETCHDGLHLGVGSLLGRPRLPCRCCRLPAPRTHSLSASPLRPRACVCAVFFAREEAATSEEDTRQGRRTSGRGRERERVCARTCSGRPPPPACAPRSCCALPTPAHTPPRGYQQHRTTHCTERSGTNGTVLPWQA